MNKKFSITIASDIDYERLIAEIYFDDEFIALINQENDNSLEIEFSERPIQNKFPYLDFIDVLVEAKKQLIGK